MEGLPQKFLLRQPQGERMDFGRMVTPDGVMDILPNLFFTDLYLRGLGIKLLGHYLRIIAR
jgi:hypothetical protein